MSPQVSLEEARQWIPGLQDGLYLDTANFGLLAAPVADKVSGLVRSLTTLPQQGASQRYVNLESQGLRARRELARLVGAGQEEIALVESTSHGLQVAAASIPVSEGDEILTASWDFPGIPLTWRFASRRTGARLREVNLGDAEDPTAVLIDSLRAETRVVCTSSVSEIEGIRLRLPDLAEACRRNGCWLVVDVIQEAGVRRMDLATSGVDVATAGGHKWLGCPFGVGFLYVRRGRLRELSSPTLGYLGLDTPPGGWAVYLSSPDAPPVTELAAAADARRFEIGGTPNFPGRFAMAESCSLLNRVGIDHIEGHVLELTGHLWERLAAMGLHLVSHRRDEARAGIVCFTLGDPVRDRLLEKMLASERVHVSCRYRSGSGGVRASIHWYNNREDVERFVTILEAMRNRGAILMG